MLYNVFITYFVPWIVIHFARLGVSTAQRDQLSTFLSDWAIKYEAYMNPATYSRVNTAEINNSYTIMNKYTSSLKQQIKSNPNVVLSVLDYVITLIHKDKKRRSSIPVPKQKCKIIVLLKSYLNTRFRVFDIDNQSSEAKPKDVKRIGVRMLLLLADSPEPTFAQLVRQPDEGTMIFDIPFTEDKDGMDGYISVCFLNDDGDEGEWSPSVKFEV